MFVTKTTTLLSDLKLGKKNFVNGRKHCHKPIGIEASDANTLSMYVLRY